MNRKQVLQYALEEYGTTPEFLWEKYPGFAVLRHVENGKWYAVLMNIPKDRLGLPSREEADVLNVKCRPELGGTLRMHAGIFPAYHMNKENWVSVLLDGSAEPALVKSLLDTSYEMTRKKRK